MNTDKHSSEESRVHPCSSVFQFLYDLCHANLPRRYPDLRPAVLKQLAHELEIIEQAGLAGYFLIVWDIVRFARANGHSLPGARVGGQLDRRLPAGHHQCRPAGATTCSSSVF